MLRTKPETKPVPGPPENKLIGVAGAEQRVAEIRAEIRTVQQRFREVEQELATLFDSTDDGRIGALRKEREELLVRVGSLVRDERAANEALLRARLRESAASLNERRDAMRERVAALGE